MKIEEAALADFRGDQRVARLVSCDELKKFGMTKFATQLLEIRQVLLPI
jgi:hypothetical protein